MLTLKDPKAQGLAIALTAIVSMLPLASPAFAASGCEAYVAEALEAANKVQELACGFDLKHPQWSTNPDVHRRWCRFASQDSVDEERASRRNKVNECSVCRGYANAAMAAIEVNQKLQCGFKGPAWVKDPARHFNWCMGINRTDHDFWGLTKPMETVQKESLDPQTAARTQAAEQCKLTHKADQALTVQPPALQPEGRPSGVSVIPNMQRPGPKGTVTPDSVSALPNMQRPGPKGTTSVDKAVTSRSSAKLPNIRTTPRNIATCRQPCKPSSVGMGRVLMKNNLGYARLSPTTMGGTRGGGLRLR
jgi:hypothetical protein